MKTLLQILVLTLVATNGYAQDNKEDAKSFFKTLVKTYFDKDCDKLYSLFNDTVTVVSSYGERVSPSKEMVNNRRACDKLEEFTEEITSFKYYIDEYKIIVLDKKEFTSKNNDSVIKQISAEKTSIIMAYEILQEFNKYYTDCDFLIFGNIHKSNNHKNISGGLFWLIVRKTKIGWKIFGTSA